jgi:hypothetical protein
MAQYQVYFDTLAGEKRYDVDIGDTESLEQVLRDILVELSEKGHTMRGLSTGDLKVIWGGREGRELDLSHSLPEQGVRPNDVLRVLVEIYEGGGIRGDRIEKEWLLLGRLAEWNPEMLEIVGRHSSAVEEVFEVRLLASPGLADAQDDRLTIREEHALRFCFTRLYPEVGIECYAAEPLFHPNIRPETGFVCLWDESRAQDTVIQALARAQAMAAFRMVNMGTAHVMNRVAAGWFETVARPLHLVPLTWNELRVFEVRAGEMVWLEPGRQLRSSAHRI